MAVEARPVVLARRPRAEVAAFIFDPGNGLSWTGGITSNRPAQPKRYYQAGEPNVQPLSRTDIRRSRRGRREDHQDPGPGTLGERGCRRRECLDHLQILGAGHPRDPTEYAQHRNGHRAHQSQQQRPRLHQVIDLSAWIESGKVIAEHQAMPWTQPRYAPTWSRCRAWATAGFKASCSTRGPASPSMAPPGSRAGRSGERETPGRRLGTSFGVTQGCARNGGPPRRVGRGGYPSRGPPLPPAAPMPELGPYRCVRT